MGNYISVQSGDWDDVATWGGGGYPSAAGDTVTINHTVDYNIVSTVELGEIIINGLLIYRTDMSTKLTLGNADIHINSGGELRVGAVDAVINKAYSADLIWNTTADATKGIYVDSGGKLTIYGDPDYYGSIDDSVLAANWTAGKTFSMVGDFANKWNIGDQITIHKGAQYTSYLTDTILCTIASLTLNGVNTDITINEAAPGVVFNAGGRVQNVSRNVRLSKLGASTVIGGFNTLRPRIYDLNNVTNNDCVMSDALVTGFFRIQSSFNFRFLRGVFRNGYYGIYYGSGHTISGAVYSNSIGIYSGSGHTISGAVYSNNLGIYYGSGHTISGAVYSNSNGIYSGSGVLITGRLGRDAAGTVALNTSDISYYSLDIAAEIYLRAADIPTTGLVFLCRNDIRYRGNVYSEDHGQVLGEHIHYAQFGTCKKDVSVVRQGGADSSIKIEPLSNCAIATPIRLYTDPMPGPLFKFWLAAGVQRTLTVYIRSLGAWASYPTAGELYIQASYLSNPATIARSLINSTATLSDPMAWVPFHITLTPARAGWVDVYLYMCKYENSKGCYVDIKPVVT